MMDRRTPVLTGRAAGAAGVLGVVLLGLMVAIAWRATSAVWFLIFPLLLLGVLAAGGVAVLWILRHF
ncbi:MAG: hypothetical protein ACRDF6_00320 [bacterium]